jgi:hypothetical protein
VPAVVFVTDIGRNDVAEKNSRGALSSMLFLGAFVLAAVAIAACSVVPASPEGIAKKMLRAHGGAAKLARLDSFVGKGFIRDLSSKVVAKSFALDVYRKGQLYKHRIMSAPGGKLTDVIVLSFDGTTSREWMNGKGTRTIPSMELGILKYRFPDVIQWIQGADRKGERLPLKKGDKVVRVRYTAGDDVVTLAVDTKTWLLDSVLVTNAKDSSFAFSEVYRYYSDVDGIPFPEEFRATIGRQLYYDYLLSAIELRTELPDSLLRVNAADSAGISKREPPAPAQSTTTEKQKTKKPEKASKPAKSTAMKR